MKTIEEAAKEYRHKTNTSECLLDGFKAGVEFAERWIPINELAPMGTQLLFKDKIGKNSVGMFIFIENKLCILTDIGYSLVEDSGFTHFRPINHK